MSKVLGSRNVSALGTLIPCVQCVMLSSVISELFIFLFLNEATPPGGCPTHARLPGFLPNEGASQFYPQKRMLVKKKEKKELQEEETDERSRWGLGQEQARRFMAH